MTPSQRMIPLALALAATGVAARIDVRAQPQDVEGRALYQDNCKKCHGVLGAPPQAMKKKYEKIPTFDAAFIATYSDDSIVKVLTHGGKTEDMKSFKDKLTPEQMLSIAKYVRQLGSRKPAGQP